MGALELRKLQNTARIVDGKLKGEHQLTDFSFLSSQGLTQCGANNRYVYQCVEVLPQLHSVGDGVLLAAGYGFVKG